MTDFVVCFDRDEAVSTNPHPDPKKPAVPLGWVKYLAHAADGVDVWATGNQTLREEAAIPGTKRALSLWETLDVEVDGRFSIPDPRRFDLPRRDRLHVVQDLYTVGGRDPTFVVVDDVDLGNMARHGWQHFFPWDFVRAVERGEAPLAIPDDHGYSDVPYGGDDEVPVVQHFERVADQSEATSRASGDQREP